MCPAIEELRVAWLIPSAASGAHWEPIWSEFLNVFQHTTFYTTTVWKEFDAEAPYAKAVKILGKVQPFLVNKKAVGYQHGLMYLPLNIVAHLLRSKPNIVITNAFSLWSIVAILLKAILGYKVIILYEGSSPNSDLKDSKIRSIARRLLSPFADAYIANNRGAQRYLQEYLKVDSTKIFCRSYLVPSKERLLSDQTADQTADQPLPTELKRPIFIFIGQLVFRKGIQQLLQACSHLTAQGYNAFTLLIVGDGKERETLQQQVKALGLDVQVVWMGRRSYGSLGMYLKQSDVFVFPTLEDSWGMVVLEAMSFGKPILCSDRAGVAEFVLEGENGHLFDPYAPETLAALMQKFIEQPESIAAMGEKSQQLIATHTPELVADFFMKSVLKITSY